MSNSSSKLDDFQDARQRSVNGNFHFNQKGRYILYWMQLYRRLEYNHALNHAISLARQLRKPLVVYEGLKLSYPWASQRLHFFILQGMLANCQRARELGLNYWAFVETPDNAGRGLVRQLAEKASVVVTDDFPAFIIPNQTGALASKTKTPVNAVDGNGLFPLAKLGKPTAAAAHLRFRLHRHFAQAWQHRTGALPRLNKTICKEIDPPFVIWRSNNLGDFLNSLPLDKTVIPVLQTPGGAPAARKRLNEFIHNGLPHYSEHRSEPASPMECPASGLSPYLHFGHIAIEEVVETVLRSISWTPKQINGKATGKRQGFYCDDDNVNAFLDEAITWRELGFLWHWHRHRRGDIACLKTALPSWANDTLTKHVTDRREFLYSMEQWEAGETHDPLWNAAQRELVATGTIHNYLRMLWGKKILEWSATPEEAYQTMVHLNNKYALDGRDPNSYSGILWCFGLFDHPWKERPVFGKVRYMSSENTARKFDLSKYLKYVATLSSKGEPSGVSPWGKEITVG